MNRRSLLKMLVAIPFASLIPAISFKKQELVMDRIKIRVVDRIDWVLIEKEVPAIGHEYLSFTSGKSI